MISIGEKIREARIARNLTQKELGNVLGLNEEVIINYENNKKRPTCNTFNCFYAYDSWLYQL